MNGCERTHHGKGFCKMHYERHARGLELPSPEWVATGVPHRRCGGLLWRRGYKGSPLLYCEKCKMKGYEAA